MTFVSCNEETLYDGPCKVRFVAEVQDEVSVTRATEGYSDLTNQTPAFDAELFVSYETTTGTPSAPGYTVSWNGSALSTSLALETGNYNFYGYAPKTNDRTTTFDLGNKTLTIPSIPALYDKDLMVIKPCSTTVISDDISIGTKTVFLQMDHLLAKITPCFYLNSTYAKLRDIRIKKVEFFFDSAPTYIATVTYETFATGYVSTQTTQLRDVTAYDVAEPTDNLPPTKEDDDLNPQVYQECGHCYIVPSQPTTNLKMKVTYDVYDKSGTLTRVNATATNQIKKLPTTLVAGTNYKLKIQVIPTYLYVLSDNDKESLEIPNN